MMALLSGCAAGPKDPTADRPPLRRVHVAEVLVQTIPRGCWVERDGEYIGVAPVAVPVEATESMRPTRLTMITVQAPDGAWERKILRRDAPIPERMLFDLRGLTTMQSGVSLAR